MRTLITGVTGQDGSYLLEKLLDRNHVVIGVARRTSTSNLGRIEHVLRDNRAFTLARGDVTDPYFLSQLIEKEQPNWIFNLAAQSHVGTSFTEAIHSIDVTAKGCINLLEILRDKPWIRLYQASSSEMFGKNADAKPAAVNLETGEVMYKTNYDRYTTNKNDALLYQNENTAFAPQSPYAIAKATAHNFVKLYREAYNLDVRTGILFNHDSERRGEDFVTRKVTKYLGELIAYTKAAGRRLYPNGTTDGVVYLDKEKEILEGAPRLKLGNLSPYRDWGYAPDYVDAMIKIMEADKPDDFVVATGDTHTVEEFVEEAFNYLKIGWRNYVDIDEELMRPAEVTYLRGDATKAKTELEWAPVVDFRGLVQRMVDYDQKNN